MTWDMLNIIGTIAFAISGAIIAMEEDYDLLGICILGLTTAFGGGMVRNLLIGIPIETVWTQSHLFEIALLSIIVVFLLPNMVMRCWNRWGTFFDAIGLAAFSIQGANYAVQSGAPLSAVLIASTLTGVGGGLVRDILARRKPMIFHSEVYAAWGILTGLSIGLDWVHGTFEIMILLVLIVSLRMCSVLFKWNLPKHFSSKSKESNVPILHPYHHELKK
ncbi:trimeric intracellular cation channel family protein [Neobacillus mesonae]|uniref:trimeric intracellular cation channel family protein n=1 Tax=Neobacillus mesonae TaxID=1193713 RepID=UPI00203B540A|nr:trimeric intracellular cation channel family protein [Neobacillus mesonae]MCM3569826.1 trimeric intracellular cation channel family protein [Neobacillus mesonae]